jgi:hypothetical protein
MVKTEVNARSRNRFSAPVLVTLHQRVISRPVRARSALVPLHDAAIQQRVVHRQDFGRVEWLLARVANDVVRLAHGFTTNHENHGPSFAVM